MTLRVILVVDVEYKYAVVFLAGAILPTQSGVTAFQV